MINGVNFNFLKPIKKLAPEINFSLKASKRTTVI